MISTNSRRPRLPIVGGGAISAVWAVGRLELRSTGPDRLGTVAAVATLRERIETIGIDLERAEGLVRSGWYRVDGEVVTDLDAETPEGSRVNVVPPAPTEHV